MASSSVLNLNTGAGNVVVEHGPTLWVRAVVRARNRWLRDAEAFVARLEASGEQLGRFVHYRVDSKRPYHRNRLDGKPGSKPGRFWWR